MVTPQHEALHRIFREDRELFARTMRHVFHQEVPVPRSVSILDTDFTEVRPHLRRGDSVLLAEFLVEEAERRYVVIIEAQRDKEADKKRSWPYYIAYLHDKYDCPVVLVVVCNDTATAGWARDPIRIGLPMFITMTVTPWVLAPDNLAPLTEPGQAGADPGLAVLAAITHGNSGQINDILEALAEALDTIDPGTAEVLAEITAAGLNETDGLTIWRALMTTHAYPYTSPLRDWFREEGLAQGREQGREQGRQEGRQEGREQGRQEGLAQGREEGMAQAVVQVLRARRIAVSDSDRDTILACRDDKTLTAWLDRAAVITDLRDLFAPVSDSAGPPAE